MIDFYVLFAKIDFEFIALLMTQMYGNTTFNGSSLNRIRDEEEQERNSYIGTRKLTPSND